METLLSSLIDLIGENGIKVVVLATLLFIILRSRIELSGIVTFLKSHIKWMVEYPKK